MTRDLTDRLVALSRAHELIRPGADAQSRAGQLGDWRFSSNRTGTRVQAKVA